jgi:hypothetical protein
MDAEKISKLNMLIKALTFNRKIMEESFNPFILDSIKESIRVELKIFENVSPLTNTINIISYANTLSSLSFDIHISNKNDKINQELLKLDHSIYDCLLENIFVQLNKVELGNPKRDLTIVIFAMKSFVYYE